MSIRLSSAKTLAITFVGIVVAYLLLAWLALPHILQSQAESYIAAKTGHRLTLDRPEFNPFELSLRIANLKLVEPDGKQLMALKELLVDVSAASIFRRALVFDNIRLDVPEATVVVLANRKLNWSPLIEALKGTDEKSDAALPRLDIQRFALAGGQIDIADQRAAFATRIQPLDLELSEISTLPDDKGSYRLSARTAFGARVHWQGEATLNPIAVAGSLGVDNLDLTSLAPYFKDWLPMGPPAGSARMSTDYRLAYAAGRLDLVLDKLTAKLAGVRLKSGTPVAAEIAIDTVDAAAGHFDLGRNILKLDTLNFSGVRVDLPQPAGATLKPMQLGSLGLEDAQVDLAGKSVSIRRIALKDGHLKAVRDARGQVDILAAWQAAPAPAASVRPVRKSAGQGWRYRVNTLELAGFSASFRDQSVTPAADLGLEDIGLAVEGVSENFAAPLKVRARFHARDGGDFEAAGKVVPAEPAADLKVKLAGLILTPAQPYLSSQAELTLASGVLAAEGRAIYNQHGGSFRGGMSLRDLRLNESTSGERFLAWKSLGSSDLEVTATKLDIPDLILAGLDTKLVIHQDKSINVSGILRKKGTAAGGATGSPMVSASAKPAMPVTPFVVNIDRLRLSNGEVDFADHSLALPFGTRIHRLRGAVIGLSSRAGAPGQVELEGQVDDYGLARAVGQIDLLNPTEFTDLKVIFRNVEMTRLTPYAATFAGRKIDSGKLSLDLEYKIKERQLAGENQIIMDQLTLGERVESAEARNLPLDLAIALLQDAEGRIDLGLPVSGSLDDPQFSYGGLIWKAIVNAVGKIATAPFRALGALFGAGEKFEHIAFETGEAQLTPPEREKLARLATALNQRPGLALTLHGVYADADRVSLQEKQLRRTVAERSGQRLQSGEHPGPLSTRAPRIQTALESLYAERFGGGDLAALKEGFRKANPGQLEQGVAGKLMSRLSGLMREEKALIDEEVATMKGADFHAILFERLRDRETVTDTQLLALARARGDNTLAGLKAAGAPGERLTLALPEKVASSGRDVPLRLV
ncbi:MAG: DUF748 domain-containing protein, partial [Sterolibacterium sp.]